MLFSTHYIRIKWYMFMIRVQKKSETITIKYDIEINHFYVGRDLWSHPTRSIYVTDVYYITDEDTEIWSN